LNIEKDVSMLMSSRVVAVATTWVAVLLSAPFTSRAAEPANADPDTDAVDSDGHGRLEDVVVTARRRAENAQDVPIPITALSGNSLEESGRYRLEDLNERLPSLNAQFANPRQTSIAVRGLGNNPANDGLESSVGVYLDDVYLGRPGMANQDLVDLDQVSLLRGPQGTLFGKNTTAGVLNLTTPRPELQAGRRDGSFVRELRLLSGSRNLVGSDRRRHVGGANFLCQDLAGRLHP
jgi:outer membrane receptor protein involved in Fe transport